MTDLLFSFFFFFMAFFFQNSAVVHKVLVTPCVCRLGIYSVGTWQQMSLIPLLSLPCVFSNCSCLINFLEDTLPDLLYFTVCFVDNESVMQTGPQVFFVCLAAPVDLSTWGFSSNISGLDRCTCWRHFYVSSTAQCHLRINDAQLLSSDQVEMQVTKTGSQFYA